VSAEVKLARRVVNAFGSGKYHVADLPVAEFAYYRWMGWFTGVPAPVVALCGAKLRGVQKVLVCMQPGTKVNCRACAHISGMAVAPEDNSELPEGAMEYGTPRPDRDTKGIPVK
jgi:hypothetical protein